MIKLSDDKLNRTEFLEDLFNLFENFGMYDDGGLTISINGQYGSGKSTILNFIQEKNNIDHKYNILRYDAWKNNLFENPLIPILYELNKLETVKGKIKNGAKNIIKNIPKILLGTLANTHKIDLTSLCLNENIFDDYKLYNTAIDKYKNILTEFCKEKKTILLIDELDRCLPEYQIKVLETLYNIFNIPNLILVVALDKNQLEHSIKQIFGNQGNVSGYLSKFIQYEVDLPENKNNKYLQTLILFQCKYPEIKNFCANMFDLANISIRNCLQIVKELNLICNEKNQDGQPKQYSYWYPLFVCFVLIVKKQNRDIYKKYFYDEIPIQRRAKSIPLNKTKFNVFLNDIQESPIENIIKYFKSREMNFAFILYFINYFHSLHEIDINSLVDYTGFEQERIEKIKDNWDIPMWQKEGFNDTLRKIRIFR